jgi:hypothetical protein
MDVLARACRFALAPALIGLVLVPTASAADAQSVADALLGDSNLEVTGAQFVAHPGGTPAAVVTEAVRLGGFPAAGETDAALLSTGDATTAAGRQWGVPADTDNPAPQELPPGSHDAAILRLDLTVPPAASCLSLRVRFLSEEYWGGTLNAESANDVFLAQVFPTALPNGQEPWLEPPPSSDWEVVAPGNFARDQYGRPLSVNGTARATPPTAGAPAVAPVSASEASAGGTVYNAATQVLRIASPVAPGTQVLYLSILDQENGGGDSAVLIDDLAVATEPSCATSVVPGEPAVTTAYPGLRNETGYPMPAEYQLFDTSTGTASVEGLVNVGAESLDGYGFSFERAHDGCGAASAPVAGTGVRAAEDGAVIGDGTALDVSVTGALSGLGPNSSYRYRLTTTRTDDGATFAGQWEPLFTRNDSAVAAQSESADPVSAPETTVHGTVLPRGPDTTYWFEYGASSCYGMKTATSPLPAGESVPVSASLTGLEPETAYHYRLVARNSTGTSYGADAAFTTPRGRGKRGRGRPPKHL